MELLAVVGANYGDEGKGLVTDYLSREDTLVVRYNGGAQAGHTVVHGPYRHVFHHFGSGSFRGARTFLSKYFLLNPMMFSKELQAMIDLNIDWGVFVDERCLVTTPYDMMINQAIEAKRGTSKHGSCGMGINETMVRSEKPEFRITFHDVSYDDIQGKLQKIRDQYVPSRIKELGLTEEDFKAFPLMDENVLKNFMTDIEVMRHEAVPTSWPELVRGERHVVFEGAQGLRLDRDNAADFPYLTNSKTGVYNAIQMMHDAKIREPLKTYYVSRCYITRHGAGPLPHERPLGFEVKDETNIPNPFQGTLRFGLLDPGLLQARIRYDRSVHDSMIWPKLVVTCMDQLPVKDKILVHLSGQNVEITHDQLTHLMMSTGTVKDVLYSYGPGAPDVGKV